MSYIYPRTPADIEKLVSEFLYEKENFIHKKRWKQEFQPEDRAYFRICVEKNLLDEMDFRGITEYRAGSNITIKIVSLGKRRKIIVSRQED